MMKSFLSSHLHLLYLLTAALLECKAQTQRRCLQVHQLNINRLKGDNMSISCLTTTHPLASLTVKLHKSNQDKDILIHPGISLASEHQRWSVRKDAGNVTLDLKVIKISDDGVYDCQVYKDQDCLHAIQFNLTVKECEKLNPVLATLNSSVLLPCSEHPLQNTTNKVIWKVIVGHQLTDITKYHHPNKPSSGTEKLLKPFYQRAKQLANESLLIRDAVQDDQLWYQCRVNEKSCYEVKLLMKDAFLETISTTLVDTVVTNVTASADSSFGLGESNRDESESESNSSVIVTTTIMSLCLLISLTICVILYFKKRRSKTNSQTQLNERLSVYYSPVADGFDVPFYSLISQNTATMTTFGAERSEAPALKHDNLYEKLTV